MSGNYPSRGTPLPDLIRSVQDLFQGRSNASGGFTVTQNAASTTVAAPNCAPGSRVWIAPTSAAAAADVGSATGVYVSAKSKGAFTVTHPNTAVAGRTFDYGIQG